VFTTNLTGYQEVLTDPSFARQIVVMTAPMIGNYGVADADAQSRRPWVAGLVVRDLSARVSRGSASGPLDDYLTEHAIPTLVGADTRAIARHIRVAGALGAMIAPASVAVDEARARLRREPPMEGRELASEVAPAGAYTVAADGTPRGRVVCLDFGVKRSSLRLLARSGFEVQVVPGLTPVQRVLELEPAGIFLSNGPGDPAALPGALHTIRSLSDEGRPLFGICLGHQLIARAFGGTTFKLRYGHRGGNHPVVDVRTGRIEITSQNHGFAVREEGGGVEDAPALRITHRSLNDGTVEGLAHRERSVFAVQYHPEAAPGPHDGRHLFCEFAAAVNATRAITTG